MNTPDTLPSECDDPDVHLGDTPRGKLLALVAFEELVKQRWEDFVNRRGEFRNEGPPERPWDEGPPYGRHSRLTRKFARGRELGREG